MSSMIQFHSWLNLLTAAQPGLVKRDLENTFLFPCLKYIILRRGYNGINIIQWYNRKIRQLQEIDLVPTILQSFSFTLYKSYTCPLMQTFFASPNSFHLRADCSLCTTTLKPLTTKKNCYTVLIYSGARAQRSTMGKKIW